MTTALTIVPKSLDEVTTLAEMLSKSTLLPDALRGKVPDVVVSILAGQELGLSPMAAIRGVHVVQGKPVLSADTMVALVLSSGACEYFSCVEDTDTRVTYETKRKGAPIAQRGSWTVEDTKRAGLNTKDNWRLYPRSMMKARAKAALARDVYPDVLAGCYTEEEITQSAPRSIAQPVRSEVIEDAVIVSDQAANEEQTAREMNNSMDSRLANALAAIENATSVEQLKNDVAQTVSDMKLSNGAKVEAENAYKAKLKKLRAETAQPAPAQPATEPAA